jgi:hypothetical protein
MSDKASRILYILALVIFLAGAGDFSMYIMQRYDHFQDGLWDQFAQTGLGIWWSVALGLAVLAFVRSKKSSA